MNSDKFVCMFVCFLYNCILLIEAVTYVGVDLVRGWLIIVVHVV